MPKSEKPVAFAPGELAQHFSASAQKLITEDRIVEIAETGNLISDDGTVELIRFIAFLNGVFSNDTE